MAHCAHQQVMIDRVEEPFDVEVNPPVIAPAALAGRPNGLVGTPAGPIAIGVGMKMPFQFRLQGLLEYALGNAIRDGGNAKQAHTACFWNLHALDRRGHVAPGGEPVPELVEVVFPILGKLD